MRKGNEMSKELERLKQQELKASEKAKELRKKIRAKEREQQEQLAKSIGLKVLKSTDDVKSVKSFEENYVVHKKGKQEETSFHFSEEERKVFEGFLDRTTEKGIYKFDQRLNLKLVEIFKRFLELH